MRYVSYESSSDEPNIIVDGSGNTGTILTLSHWPHSGTPQEFKADSSAEIALNFLRSPRRAEFESRAQVVSNNHFDEDGLMSVWAMTHPEQAIELQEQVVGVATAGDFSRVLMPEYAQIVYAINALAAKTDGDKYQALLPKVESLLRNPEKHESLWREDWQRLESDFALIASGEANITEHANIDLAIVESPRPIDQMAICSRTNCLRVLTIFGEGFYKLQYCYESWVQVVSRIVRPRIDLYALAESLQRVEQVHGTWKHGDTADIMPSLEFVDFEGTPTPSGIPRAQLISEVVSFFEREQDNPALQWSPYDSTEGSGCGIVYEQSQPAQPATGLHQLGGLSKRNED